MANLPFLSILLLFFCKISTTVLIKLSCSCSCLITVNNCSFLMFILTLVNSCLLWSAQFFLFKHLFFPAFPLNSSASLCLFSWGPLSHKFNCSGDVLQRMAFESVGRDSQDLGQAHHQGKQVAEPLRSHNRTRSVNFECISAQLSL